MTLLIKNQHAKKVLKFSHKYALTAISTDSKKKNMRLDKTNVSS